MQENAWEKEYQKSKLLTKDNKPQNDVVRFVKFLKKKLKRAGTEFPMKDLKVLDLGSGTGRNSFYFAELGAEAFGFEISDTAIKIARERAEGSGLTIKYLKQNIGAKFLCEDRSVGILLDVTSSNSLDEKGRELYLAECHRVLKPDGFFFVKALCKEGDANAKNLLKISPGKEYDTYYMKELDLYERVFSREDFINLYGKYFKILELNKKTSYSCLNDRSYKRNFWVGYLTTKE
ncbi:MAG: class I SAM-dependent methyltransferase [Candidatus Pacebacteria bacterium]|nr:class I SAM-dependent methyltransferase [Candidatus Paceibacterota bacterium]